MQQTSQSRSFVRRSALLITLAACGDGMADHPTPPADISVSRQAVVETADTFIATRLDDRTCGSPACGGYFVKLINQNFTACADGSIAADCHVGRLDFAATGLSPAEAARFEQSSFSTLNGLVEGSLSSGDVLRVTGAWEGQAHAAAKGSWVRIVPTGKMCLARPCDSFEGDRLNSAVVHDYNAIGLTASGASADAVARATQALTGPGIVAAGIEVLVTGPAGRGKDFSAAEFYLRVTPCVPDDARGAGACTQLLGYKWDGAACGAVTGCSCSGTACGGLAPGLAACKSAHVICSEGCGQPGRQICSDRQYCDFPDAYACGAAAQPGDCHTRPEICAAIYRPACGCDGKTYGNPCEAHAAGVDIAALGACK
jgi:hypothetical protein